MAESKATGYGGRLDVYQEYGQLHFQYDDGHWTQLDEIAECDDNLTSCSQRLVLADSSPSHNSQ